MATSNEARQRRFNLVVGSPGAGKSTFTAESIKSYNSGNVILYKHAGNIDDAAFNFLPVKTQSNWRQGASPGTPVKCKFAGDTGTEYTGFLTWVKDSFRNGMLVIDDATIFERDRLTKEMNYLVTMRRHLGIDIWLIYHGLTLLPIEQFIFVNHIVLFNTNDNLKYKASRLPNYQLLLQGVQQARNNYASGGALRYTPAVVPLT